MGQVRGARARRAQRLGWDADRASQCSMHARSDRAARSRVGDRRGPCPPPRSGCGCFARLANRTPRDDGQRERAVALRVIAVCCVPSSSHPHQRIRARTGCGQSSSPASHSGGRPGEPGQASQSPSTSSHPPRAHPHPHPCRVRLRSPSHASALLASDPAGSPSQRPVVSNGTPARTEGAPSFSLSPAACTPQLLRPARGGESPRPKPPVHHVHPRPIARSHTPRAAVQLRNRTQARGDTPDGRPRMTSVRYVCTAQKPLQRPIVAVGTPFGGQS